MRRLLRRRGRLAFTTIELAFGLTTAQRRRAIAAGPPALSGPDAGELLDRIGFTRTASEDVTAGYLATTSAWRAARLRHRDQLRPLAPQVFDDRIAQCTGEIASLEAGLIRRTLYVATR
jgi:hypothetical protein